MSYTFTSLSPADFEDLVRDLIGRELDLRFEAFGPGPDGGMDGRHAQSGKSTILQAKHYAGSNFAALRAAMRRERASIDKLAASRYVLATSRPLSHRNKAVLADLIGPSLKSEADIFGPEDLNGRLRAYPDVEKAHIKLWLSGTGVLERVLRSAAHTFTKMAREEIEAKVRVYAQNPSFADSRDKLETHHVLIITGPPGVGKTTLAEMLSYAYIGEDWELVAIRSLDDGLASIVDARKQIFLFDDFLGKVALDARALASRDSDLVRFMTRVRNSTNARFILTTRSYILEQARQVSESLADRRLDVTKYILDVGIYTRRVKARILYNHIIVARTPRDHIRALVESEKIGEIVDHANYNPRIVEWMTDALRIGDVSPEEYPRAFLDALANPRQLWDIAFRTHISQSCQHLLLALFFCSEYGADIDDLRASFDALHHRLCEKYGIPRTPKDFEDAVKTLEGGFIHISSDRISYVNPSLRDYIAGYLDDIALLSEFAIAAQRCNWAEAAWRHGLTLSLDRDAKRKLAKSFADIASRFSTLRIMKPVRDWPNANSIADRTNVDRMSLLLEWWAASGDGKFADLALEQARNPVAGFDSWLDGSDMIELALKLRGGAEYPNLQCAVDIIDALESGLVNMFDGWVSIDTLERLYDRIEDAGTGLGRQVGEAARNAVVRWIDEVRYYIDDEDSESTLEDHVKSLEKLAPRAGVAKPELERAISTIRDRMSDLSEKPVADSPSISGRRRETEKFDDNDLRNLFAPLLEG